MCVEDCFCGFEGWGFERGGSVLPLFHAGVVVLAVCEYLVEAEAVEEFSVVFVGVEYDSRSVLFFRVEAQHGDDPDEGAVHSGARVEVDGYSADWSVLELECEVSERGADFERGPALHLHVVLVVLHRH